MTYPAPILRIEVEGVKHSIVQHLGGCAQEMEEIVQEELDRLDIETMVREEIRRQGPHIVQQAVQEAGQRLSKSISSRLVDDFHDVIWDWKK